MLRHANQKKQHQRSPGGPAALSLLAALLTELTKLTVSNSEQQLAVTLVICYPQSCILQLFKGKRSPQK